MSVYLWHTECQSMRQDLFTPSTAIKTLISTPTITLSKPPDVVPIYIIAVSMPMMVLAVATCLFIIFIAMKCRGKKSVVTEDVSLQKNEAYCTVTTRVPMKRNEAYETVLRANEDSESGYEI
ncbi:hypothetical protein GBAR_LOCUS15752, partial [Geodia barretti]